MNRKITAALYKKEIVDILRDKKTMLMMVVMPLVLYPLIFALSMVIASNMMTQSTTKAYSVGFSSECGILADFVSANQVTYEYEFNIVHGEFESLSSNLIHKEISAFVTADENEGTTEFTIHYLSSESDSQTAYQMLVNMIKLYQKDVTEQKVESYGLDTEQVLYSIKYKSEDIATKEESMGYLIGYIVPFLLISSVLMGALYPAIDTTAGEKERGTLETMLTLPVKNIDLIMGKFLATATIAVAAAFLNVISMGVMGMYLYQTIYAVNTEGEAISFSVYIPAVLIALLCAVVFALFCSAVCLLICIFAKSFKEAQNFTTPIMLIFMFASMAGMIPAIKLNETTALIPVINIALLLGKLFLMEYNPGIIFIVLLSNIAYSILAVVLMAKMFSSESILFSESSEGIRIIEKRSDMKEKQMPGYGDLLLLFAILLVVVLLGGSVFVLKYGIWGLVIEQLMILGITLFYSWYMKADFQKLFSVSKTKPVYFLYATITWLGVYIIMLFVSALLTYFFPASAAAADSNLFDIWEGKSIITIILSSALLPAICEESAFRGFLFGTLKNKIGIVTAIVITGAVFGMYHMSLVKLIPVGILGGLLAYVVYKTKSIFVSIWMHFLNNLASVLVSQYEESLSKRFPTLFGDNLGAGTIAILIVVSFLCILIGLLLINHTCKKTDLRMSEK